jgi:hypothetical protein
MKKCLVLVALILILLTAAGCAPDPNPQAGGENAAGFWAGLWHGLIVIFTFVISLFNDKVTMYEVANNGGWYNFGFLLGVMMVFGGGGGGAASGKRR